MKRRMTTFERRKAISEFIAVNASAKVDELASLFTVSLGTIRNDLTTLEEQGLLARVRGGAVAPGELSFASRKSDGDQLNEPAIDRIAKWSAELVQDRDVILLDASNTALKMASYLREHKNLTVVTPRLTTARLLAASPNNTVILTGGILSSDGKSVTGELSQEILKNLHIKTAFLTCAALSPEAGLMDSDLQEVQFKRQAFTSASRVVALLESSAFENVGLFPVAPLEDLDQVVTDEKIKDATVASLHAANITVTVCGADVVQTLKPLRIRDRRHRIGFANLSESLLFPVDVRRSLEAAAEDYKVVDLVFADNAMDSSTAIRAAEYLLDEGIELLIEYQIDEKANHQIMNLLQRRGVPAIAIDIPIVGATYFGVDNYRSGYMAGEGLGQWVMENWEGAIDYVFVLEEKRAGALPAARIEGQIQGLHEALGNNSSHETIFLDSGNTKEVSRNAILTTLRGIPHESKLAVLSFNDDAALGALEAMRTAGWQDTAIVGQGADRRLREELRRPSTPIIGSTAFHPECYGSQVLDIAMKILHGDAVPPAVYINHTFITPDNVDKHYPRDLVAVGTGKE